jgi:CRP-like cAMP-binding protein
MRMEVGVFRAETAAAGAFREAIEHYTHAVLSQISQSVACSHLHSVEQRMCRWLLMMHDRVGSDDLPLTQEFLAQMLGVRRPSVTVIASALQQAGLIRYRRGLVTVLDRAQLETASCECYQVVRTEFERLLLPDDQ